MVFALQKPHVALRHAADWFVAGAEGFEPPYGGTKTRCLTAWLRPNETACRTQNTVKESKNLLSAQRLPKN